jgi:hypothetical protein
MTYPIIFLVVTLTALLVTVNAFLSIGGKNLWNVFLHLLTKHHKDTA